MASTNLADIKAESQGGASRDVSIFSYLEDPRVAKGISAVAGKFLTPDRFLRLAVNAVKKTPLLLKCDTQSVLGAFMTSAALGLEPNTIQQQAFLIPYKKRRKEGNQWIDSYECQFQIGYRGFVTLAYRSPQIDSLQAESIHKNDHFEHMLGSKSFLEYRKALTDRGDLIGSFCFVKLSSGAEVATILPLSEVVKIRSKSETYNALARAVEQAENDKDRKKAEEKFAETPWVMWEDDMAAKSAIKKQGKQLPLNPGDALIAAAEIDDNAERNVIDLKAMADPDVVRSVVSEGYEPPALSHQEPDRLPTDFGGRTEETQHVRQAASNEQRQQSDQEQGGQWRPDPEEEARIRAQEIAEANRERQGDPQQSGRRGRGQQQSFVAE